MSQKHIISPSILTYLADPTVSYEQVEAVCGAGGGLLWLGRRDYALGWVAAGRGGDGVPTRDEARRCWQAARPVVLPGMVREPLTDRDADLAAAQRLMERVLAGEDVAVLLRQAPYGSRLAEYFTLVTSSFDEGDDQEIETVEFEVERGGQVVADNLWLKVSWLSFHDEDASLRFRFSFGWVAQEDVAADFRRQRWAAALTEAVFPESGVISANGRLAEYLRQVLEVDAVVYVERIVYFNAPNGGAQFHHDVERGHLGVVYAQVRGRTVWFALAKADLVDEVLAFLARTDACSHVLQAGVDSEQWQAFQANGVSPEMIAGQLDDLESDVLEALINRVPAFARQLIDNGYGWLLEPGDAILLPQQQVEHCAWHSVFCVDDEPGEGLSFAIRAQPAVDVGDAPSFNS